jgi:hypothetical protein
MSRKSVQLIQTAQDRRTDMTTATGVFYDHTYAPKKTYRPYQKLAPRYNPQSLTTVTEQLEIKPSVEEL